MDSAAGSAPHPLILGVKDPAEAALGAVMDDAGICAPLQAVAAVVPGFERQLAGMGGKLQVTKCAYESGPKGCNAR